MGKEKVDVEKIYQHYRDTIGDVPEPFLQLGKHIPEVLESYYRVRNRFYKGSLDAKVKELIIIAMNCCLGAPLESTKMHIQSALKAGAKKEEIFDVIGMTFMAAGVIKFANLGYKAMVSTAELESK